jgi:hypothetical protein
MALQLVTWSLSSVIMPAERVAAVVRCYHSSFVPVVALRLGTSFASVSSDHVVRGSPDPVPAS